MNFNFPKISIITPNFNGVQFLEETIQSVINQNYPNLEYVIIDGGSTDGSIDIIKKYESRLAFWVSEPDNGMYNAIQKGFEHSTGEIMAWINSDDIFLPGAFLIISEIFSNFEEVCWLTATPAAVDEKGRTIRIGDCRSWSRYDFLTADYKWIQQESTFWRRTLWQKAGNRFDLSLKYAADFELWLRFFRFEKLYSTRSLIGEFRWKTENQISLLHYDKYEKEAESVIKSEILSEKESKIVKAYNRLAKVNNLLCKLRIFRTDWIQRFKKRNFGYPPELSFSWEEQRFKMNK